MEFLLSYTPILNDNRPCFPLFLPLPSHYHSVTISLALGRHTILSCYFPTMGRIGVYK